MSDHRIIADYHTHTKFSHGQGSPRDNVLAAIDRGLDEIAVTEHGPGHMTYGVRGKMLSLLNSDLLYLKREFAGRIDVLNGLELNVVDFGKADVPSDRDAYDIIIIGYHKGVPPKNPFARGIWRESLLGIKNDPHKSAESLLAAAEECRANIISHPNLYVKVDIPYLADCCRELGIMLEVNSSHVSLTDDEIRAIKGAGCRLVINSDAHSPERVGDFSLAAEAVTRADAWDAVKNAVKIDS
ncbi:MAG: PHP domain-containing protein [Clostridia bacterium]|nr:PHP domain-containing protein [Clostridia bacterium]